MGPRSKIDVVLVDTLSALQNLIDNIPENDAGDFEPRLYVDLEGNNLSRHGTISILTVLVEPAHKVYLVDITTLQREAFTTKSNISHRSLKSVLESEDVTKVFFDIRNDSDALFSLFGIHVAGIKDLQLMELASRSFHKRYVNSLAKCIENDARLPWDINREWQAAKTKGRRLFAPEMGGNYAVFDQRPLSEELKRYCGQDVSLLPKLWQEYSEKLCDAWWTKIDAETVARIQLSQSHGYDGQGCHKALGPVHWRHWRPTPTESTTRTRFVRRPIPVPEPHEVGTDSSTSLLQLANLTIAALDSLKTSEDNLSSTARSASGPAPQFSK